MMIKKNICLVGLGYIGLPTAALLANKGFNVLGVDIQKDVVETVNKGEIHIVEPELDVFVQAAVKSGNLKASMKPATSDIFIIAVPTPFKKGFIPDIDHVISATKSISPFIKSGDIVILESTSPVGTTEKIQTTFINLGLDVSDIYIAHCPERVLPGKIMKELVENDRIVGGLTQKATKKTAEFYREFVSGEVLETDARTAEMTKLVENSYRDTNIAFANELSILCDKLSINVWELIRLANHHPRVNILQPGVGVGGHCIAVDPWFLVYAGEGDAKLIQKAREVNLYKSEWVIEKIKNKINEFKLKTNKDPKVACLGLAFKPNIDDLRESPALAIVRRLILEDADILAVEPNINSFKEFEIYEFTDAIQKSDIVLLLVAHKEFREINHPNVMDFCGVLNSL